MNSLSESAARVRVHLTCSMLLFLAAACGGGGVGSGGTGGAVVGSSVGTVTGFGSVIVDGATYVENSASVLREVAPGQDAIAEVKLGARISVRYSVPGVADVIRVEAALAGPVASVDPSGLLVVLGQTVSINTGLDPGPLTELSGYANAAAIVPGDIVEVHGVISQAAGGTTIRTTRVEKLPALPLFLRVTGIVSGLANGGAAFNLGALTVDAAAASVLPSRAALANGRMVTVLAPPAALTTPTPLSPRLVASQVRLGELQDGGLGVSISGAVAQLDPTARTFVLGGLPVRYGQATISPAGATLSNDAYVVVQGTLAADGSLTAAVVSVRSEIESNESELKGNISAFDSATQRFTVREVLVDAAGATLLNCPATGLANGLYVEIEGSLSGSGVSARTVSCQPEPVGGTIEREGVVQNVDVAAKTFQLVKSGTTTQAAWTDRTFFGQGLTPATMAGKKVEVDGTLSAGVLVATKISQDD